jgi:hypothetical protein
MRSTILYRKKGRSKTKPKQSFRDYRRSSTKAFKQAEERRLFGSHGAASDVRRIDPATGKVIEIIPAHDRDTGTPRYGLG